MNKLYKTIKTFPILKAFSSIKITVTCLSLLFILTLWGTIDQVENGLYHAQEQFFNSFFFPVFGVIPFPGAQMVLWVLFINLVCVSLTRFVYKLSNIGILIIHLGLLTYFVAAYVTLHCVEESNITIMEGESSNVSSSYHDWELSIWKQEKGKKEVLAYDSKKFKPGQVLDFSKYGFSLTVREYFPNSHPDTLRKNRNIPFKSGSGISNLNRVELSKEPERNLPGGEFLLTAKGQKDTGVLLFGGDLFPTEVKLNKQTYQIMLRRKRFFLPLSVKLIDFTKEIHPNTDVARSYKSKVEIDALGVDREVTISMNNPLRFKDYTLYQASYSIDSQGREASTLAVVKNKGRLLPYIASIVTSVGLLTHFLLMAFRSRKSPPA